MIKNPTYYFSRKWLANLDKINHECHGEKLEGSCKECKTINKDDFKNIPEKEKKRRYC